VTHLIPLIVIIPLLLGIISFVFKRYARYFGVLMGFLWFVLLLFLYAQTQEERNIVYHFAGFYAPLGIEFVARPLNSFLLMASSWIVLMCCLYAFFYLKKPKHRLFYPLTAFLCSGLSVLFLSNDVFNIYVGLEIVGLSAVSLTALQAGKKSIKAAIKYLFATLVASGLYLFAVVLLYINYSTLHIQELGVLIKDDVLTSFAYAFIVFALIIKTALFPFHDWLVQAHSNALTPISALLSAVVIKSSFYLLFFMSFEVFIFSDYINKFVGYLGLVAIFYGGIHAFFATKLKLLIAYSTVSQIGYLFVVFALNNAFALSASLFIVLSHMFAKAGLFLIAGVMILAAQSKSIKALKGIGYVFPLTVFTLAFSAIGLIGFPPSLGFSAKWYYLQSAFQEQNWVVFIVLLFATLITAAYFFKLIILTLRPTPKNKHFVRLDGFALNALQIIAFSLSLLSVVLGVFSYEIVQMMRG
jgi:formate hydrogenlyase subunit 3/multisubunit Na+/H+ antiporter MnhD subunit